MNGDHSLAVHALVYLDHRATHLPSQILAENICTNAARVRKVMRPLASAGLIATKEGAEGGYALARPAAEITLRAVAEATGTTFVKVNWTPGDVHEDCLVSSSMGAVTSMPGSTALASNNSNTPPSTTSPNRYSASAKANNPARFP
jgi:DNA-binding IscR family transcriptional regulator